MPAINEIYGSQFKSHSGVTWSVTISDDYQTSLPTAESWDYEFKSQGKGFQLSYHGGNLDVFDPIKSSSLSFVWFINNSTQEAALDAIFDTNSDINWYVQVWKGSDLYWWGYLQESTNVKPNQDYNTTWSFEAVDTLGLCQDIKIWDNSTTISGYSMPGYSWPIRVGLHRFGEIRAVLGTYYWSKEHPTPVDIVYSILYDLDQDITGELDVYTYWNQLPTSFIGGELWPHHTTVMNWFHLYGDYPSTATPWPVQYKESATVADILRDVCNLFCFRIFQEGGKYVLWQPEIYQSGTYTRPKNYVKTPNTIYSTNPTYNGKGTTLTPPEYMSTPPNILGGNSTWEKLHGIHVTALTGKEGTTFGLFDARYTREVSSETVTMSSQSRKENAITSLYPNVFVFGPYTSTLTGQPITQTFTVPGGLSYQDTYTRNVVSRSEMRNGTRLVFNAEFKDVDYTFMKGITYDSIDYMPHEITFNANLERWSGKWIEAKNSSDDLGDVVTEPLDPVSQNWEVTHWYLSKG